MNKKLTNEEFINELMCFSTYGALTQVFVIEAIRYYAEQVANTPEPTESDGSLLNPVIWHAIAKDIQKALKENYETSI